MSTTVSHRRSRNTAPAAPLGSLISQRQVPHCETCGSPRVTRLAIHLTDGTPVLFTSCHHCEVRRWEHHGSEMSVQAVLDHTRKPA